MAKMSIDLQRGLIEVDGDEKFVERVYSDMKSLVLQKLSDVAPLTPHDEAKSAAEKVDVEKVSRKRAKSTGPSCASRIEALKTEDFFKEPKTPRQIGSRLKEKGTTYESKNIAAALTSLTKSVKLMRFNQDGWNYQNP